MTQHDPTSMQDLAAAYALGALSPEDARVFEDFLASSPEARREAAEFREVSALLATQAPDADADADLKNRVLQRIASMKGRALSPQAPPRVPAGYWLALAATVVLAVGLGTVLIGTRRQLAVRTVAMDSMRQRLDASLAQLSSREATLNWILDPAVELNQLTSTGDSKPIIQLFWNRRTNAVMAHAFNLAPAPAGHEYQLWFIKDGKPVPSVTFNSEESGHALVQGIRAPEGGGITHAAITLEPAGGSPQPTTPVILIGATGA